MRAWFLATQSLLTALLVSCSGGDNNPAGPGDDPTDPGLPQQPNPADVTVTMDPGRIASARIPTTGGTIQATGADGTVYTLTIPADALVSDTTISMTPLTSVSGLDVSGGRFVGVQLEPDGLRFFQHATLQISPPEGTRHSAVGFAYHGAGSEVYRVPLTTNPDLLEMHLLHFSGATIYVGDNIHISPGVVNLTPTEWEDRIQSFLESFFREERERALQGLPLDPNRDAYLREAFHTYYDEVIQPTLNQMMTDCSFAHTAVPRAFSWERNVELLGMGDDFKPEEATLMNALVKATENCFRQTKGDCLDTSNPQQMSDAATYSHTLEVLGVHDPAYNPLNPDNHCKLDWNGTATRTKDVYANGSRDVVTATVQWELNPERSDAASGVFAYRVRKGSVVWQIDATDESGCKVKGGPETFDLAPTDGELILDGISQTYTGSGVLTRFVTVNVTCPAPLPSGPSSWAVTDWLSIPATPFAADATELSGLFDFAGVNTVYEWHFRK
jgi:hypothetical protein